MCMCVCQDFYILQLFMRGCMRGMLQCIWITPTQNSFIGDYKKSFWILRPPQHRSAVCHLINHHGGGIR